MEVTQKIRVDGEVNKAQCMPHNPIVMGTKTSGCDVYVFDCSKQLEKQQRGDREPDLILCMLEKQLVVNAHEMLGEDVSWLSKNENLFGSVGDDYHLMIWDLRTNQPQQSVKAHEREHRVKVFLVKRGIVEEESYPICRKELESIIHALQDCPRIKTVWVQLGIRASNGAF
nr:WD-40 repeat-containing protein MSI2-like [Quercus suber]